MISISSCDWCGCGLGYPCAIWPATLPFFALLLATSTRSRIGEPRWSLSFALTAGLRSPAVLTLQCSSLAPPSTMTPTPLASWDKSRWWTPLILPKVDVRWLMARPPPSCINNMGMFLVVEIQVDAMDQRVRSSCTPYEKRFAPPNSCTCTPKM